MNHSIESLAKLFLGQRSVMRTSDKQGKWLDSVIRQELRGHYRGELIHVDGVVIEQIGLQGRSSDFKISTTRAA